MQNKDNSSIELLLVLLLITLITLLFKDELLLLASDMIEKIVEQLRK